MVRGWLIWTLSVTKSIAVVLSLFTISARQNNTEFASLTRFWFEIQTNENSKSRKKAKKKNWNRIPRPCHKKTFEDQTKSFSDRESEMF